MKENATSPQRGSLQIQNGFAEATKFGTFEGSLMQSAIKLSVGQCWISKSCIKIFDNHVLHVHLNKSRNIKIQKEWKLNMIQGYLYQKMIEVKASMKRSKWTRVLRGLNLDMLTFIDNTTKNSISGSLSYKVIPKVILHSQKRFILFIKRFWFFSTTYICSNSYIAFS